MTHEAFIPLEPGRIIPMTKNQMVAHAKNMMKEMGWTYKQAMDGVRHAQERDQKLEVWKSSQYTVLVERNCKVGDGWPAMDWLSIRRDDRQAIHDWRHFQQIKNQLVGPENEAIELYPAESRLVDTANQYHLWVFRDPNGRLPFGFTERAVMDGGANDSGAVQRPLDYTT